MPRPPIPRLVLFSGLGLGRELVGPQLALPFRVEVPPWLDPAAGESLRAYAVRMARTVDPTPPLYLAGLSFGAMVALEAIPLLRPAAVFMIAGAWRGDAVSPVVRLAARIGQVSPLAGVRLTLDLAPLAFGVFAPIGRAARADLAGIMPTSSARMFRWGGPAVLDWRYTGGQPPCPVHHVHGAEDKVIPSRHVRPDCIVPRAGHLVNLTHAGVVNDFLTARIAAHAAATGW